MKLPRTRKLGRTKAEKGPLFITVFHVIANELSGKLHKICYNLIVLVVLTGTGKCMLVV